MTPPAPYEFLNVFASPRTTAAPADATDWQWCSRREVTHGGGLTVALARDRRVLRAAVHRRHRGHAVATAVWCPPGRPGALVPPRDVLAALPGALLAVTLVELSPLAYLSYARPDQPSIGPARRLLTHLGATPALPPTSAMMGLERIPVVILSAIHSLADLRPLLRRLRSTRLSDLDAAGPATGKVHALTAAFDRRCEAAWRRHLGGNAAGWRAHEEAVSDLVTMLAPPAIGGLGADRRLEPWRGGVAELTRDGAVWLSRDRVLVGPIDRISQQSDLLTPGDPTKTDRSIDLRDLAQLAERDAEDGVSRVLLPWLSAGASPATDSPPTSAGRRAYQAQLEADTLQVGDRIEALVSRRPLRAGTMGDAAGMVDTLTGEVPRLLTADVAAFVEVFSALSQLEGTAPSPTLAGTTDPTLPPHRSWLAQVRRVMKQLRLRGQTLHRPPNLQGFDNRVAFEITRHAVRALARAFLAAHTRTTPSVLLIEVADSQPQVDTHGLPHGVSIHMPDAWVEHPFWWTTTLLHELSHARLADPSPATTTPARRWRADLFAQLRRLFPGGRVPSRTAPLSVLLRALRPPSDRHRLLRVVADLGTELVVDVMVVAQLQAHSEADDPAAAAWSSLWWSWLPAVVRTVGLDPADAPGGALPQVSEDAVLRLTLRMLLLKLVETTATDGPPAWLSRPDAVATQIAAAVARVMDRPAPPHQDPDAAPVSAALAPVLDWFRANTQRPSTLGGLPRLNDRGRFLAAGAALSADDLSVLSALFTTIHSLARSLLTTRPLDRQPPRDAPCPILRATAAFLAAHRAADPDHPHRVALPIVPRGPGRPSGLGICAHTGTLVGPAATTEALARIEHDHLLTLANLDRWKRLDVLDKALGDVAPDRTGSAPPA